MLADHLLFRLRVQIPEACEAVPEERLETVSPVKWGVQALLANHSAMST